MHLLICSDGTDPADKPTRLGGIIGSACGAKATLLGIAERADAEDLLRAALASESKLLTERGLEHEVIIRTGDPVEQILGQTAEKKYDVVVIGTRLKQRSGRHWRSARTYEVIKAIPPPVLIATGDCETVTRALVCTGGKRYIDAAVQLTGEIAACVKAEVTLLHVMAEPPAIFADLVRREEDVEGLLAGGSELGENLRAQKESLEKLGVPTTVRVRHGIVLDQVFAELREGGHDLIVTGTSQARGALQHYIMGDLTRSIVNRADCPVLVARPTNGRSGGFWAALQRAFSSGARPAK